MRTAGSDTSLIKTTARDLGFDYCGIAKAAKLEDDARRLETWLKNNHHGRMGYMENHFDLRIDPQKLVPGAKSVITLLKNYTPNQAMPAGGPRISAYAYGNDYHFVIREKLNEFLERLKEKGVSVEGRGFVDSAPVLERAWAVKSGLGWVGRNGNLLTKSGGSYFFIASLITDLVLEPDGAFNRDYCGTCNKCVEACPTAALLPGRVVDGSRCISYYTIELKDRFKSEVSLNWQDWIFGCDICQEVCPWNRFAKPHNEPQFAPVPGLFNLKRKDWEEMAPPVFKEMFAHSALLRTGLKGLKLNLEWIRPGHKA